MPKAVAIIGAGVSGLSCGAMFAERGHRAVIFAEDIGQQTTSAAAGAIWFPYDAEPAAKVIPWALKTYAVLLDLSEKQGTGVSMIELHAFSRTGDLPIPAWAIAIGARAVEPSMFVLTVPLTDTAIYLDYLAKRFRAAGGEIQGNVRFENLEEVDRSFDLLINCAGFGAKKLVRDLDLEPHRGQVVMVSKIDLPHAIVCDDAPLMYAIPRANDCLFGGTNEISDDRHPDPDTTSRIVAECSRVLAIDAPEVLAERVGIRPFRKSGVRVAREKLRDGRSVIHNYGHGGSGFTLSWGCAENVFALTQQE